jgi:hypothetical protein
MSLTMSNKRSRSDTGWSNKAKLAAMLGARTNARYPYSKYGRSYTQRGVPNSQSLLAYGDTWKTATAAQRANRKAHGYTGRGGFFADLGKWAGRAVGGLLGNKDRGGMIGGGIGKGYEMLTGKGLYTGRGVYDSNVLVQGPNLDPRPALHFSGTGDETATLVMSQKEYIGDVFAPSNSNFVNTSYDLNPGLVANFPFLAQYAQNFEEYEFEQLVFEYHSTVDASSTNNPNGNTGTVIMATNYNVSSPAFTDKEQMIQYHGGVSGRMTDNLTHGVECDPSKNAGSPQKYVRTFIPVNQDLKSYDLGKFQIAFQNIPQSYFDQQVGELWVYYKVKLSKPRLYSAQSGNVQIYRAISNLGVVTANAGAGAGMVATQNMLKGPNNDDQVYPYLTALGNSLPCQLESVSLPTPLGDACGIKVIFPAATNGTFEVTIKTRAYNLVTGGVATLNGLAPWYDLVNPGSVNMGTDLGGNVTPWADMYGGVIDNSAAVIGSNNLGLGISSPVWNQVYHHSPSSGTFAGNGAIACSNVCIAHVNVKSATAGVDNYLSMAYLRINQVPAGANVSGWEVTVREISPFLATSPGIQAPLFQDPSGTVTTPS